MLRSRFVPANNSRHRTAALALYRALLRTSKQVPLPSKTVTKGKAFPSVHPVAHLFLYFLSLAQTEGSPEHTHVVQYVSRHKRLHPLTPRGRRAKQAAATPADAALYAGPLLTRIETPGELPSYVPGIRPRPKEALTGSRKIPSLSTTAQGMPFLRIRKPQPAIMSKMIGQCDRKYKEMMARLTSAEEDMAVDAALEDQWDRLVEQQMMQEYGGDRKAPNEAHATFVWSVALTRLWLKWRVENMWQKWNARGEALNKIVEQERALLAQESADTASPEDQVTVSTRSQQQGPSEPRIRHLFEDPFKEQFHLVRLALRAHQDANSDDSKDLTLSRAWSTIIDAEYGSLRKMVAKFSHLGR
ncbi:hypothetical protein S40285_05940 [Stachybotrys chlorohalonatus IBT 40285]|uniref:Uncharacterized protein n=1 Tax=Stachybotrys chlorohalonatus (strain IBT 40285) TaxID=1283841 RepID=A0A084QVD7_STAC4|nr:hypothetical protein S40285_05940 [Stachybotrys chlorohalonata IBT 40285]